MWPCPHCGAEVENDFEVCWNCSTPRSGASYEEFLATIPGATARARTAAFEDEQIAVLQAIEDGLVAVVRHRILLLAGVLLVASRLGESLFMAPAISRVDAANPVALLLPLLRWQSLVWWAESLVVGALADGFVIAFVYGIARGRTSQSEAASSLVPRLPSLVGARVIVGMISLVPLLLALWSPVALWWCAFALQLYLTVRLVFWQEVIVVEAAGVARSLRRSWQLVRGNWWRLAFLVVVTWGCGMLFRLLPAYLAVPVGSLFRVVGDAVMASAYLQRVGLLPRRRPTLTELVTADADARAGFPGGC